MNGYRIDNKYEYISRTVTDGTQRKYKKGEFFYKINKNGNEGYVEYLVYRLLCKSTIPKDMLVRYEYCRINDRLGCRSKDFLTDNEQFMTISTVYERVTGNTNLSNKLMTMENASQRLQYIVRIINEIGLSEEDFLIYFRVLIQLDWLIVNVDRHEHNYGVIYNSKTARFRIAPVFDNGMSLNTDRRDNLAACTLSGSFEEQVTAFGYPVVPAFKIDYKEAFAELKRIEKLYGEHRELDMLKSRLLLLRSTFEMK